ncbi:Lipopolysaccharide export system ATP-binding protein LptB [bacterium HR40]|nr:Lipopolysaccharide export system ATP-binding protein LptB [bacterium HR40]
MAEPVLVAEGLVRRFGAIAAVDGVSLALATGEIHALIGPNGAGKTTLVNLLSGELAPQAGRILFLGRDITPLPVHARARLGLARSYQIASVVGGLTALENVALALQAHAGSSFRFFADCSGEAELEAGAKELLARVGLAARAEVPAGLLAHGEKRALELAMVLAGSPKVLLLDEPLAGAGTEESRRIVELVAGLREGRAILLIEHDMDAVFRLADRVTVLVYGRVIASGTPAEVRRDAGVRAAYLGEEAMA